jgi:hypothetical protein
MWSEGNSKEKKVDGAGTLFVTFEIRFIKCVSTLLFVS